MTILTAMSASAAPAAIAATPAHAFDLTFWLTAGAILVLLTLSAFFAKTSSMIASVPPASVSMIKPLFLAIVSAGA